MNAGGRSEEGGARREEGRGRKEGAGRRRRRRRRWREAGGPGTLAHRLAKPLPRPHRAKSQPTNQTHVIPYRVSGHMVVSDQLSLQFVRKIYLQIVICKIYNVGMPEYGVLTCLNATIMTVRPADKCNVGILYMIFYLDVTFIEQPF